MGDVPRGTGGVYIHPGAPINTPLQRRVIQNFIECLEDPDAAVVITNPIGRDNPIIYVTKGWQDMCGFTYDDVVGRNPRLMLGTSTDLNAVRAMADAVAKRRACKALIVNYRGGEQRRPFWNMLSISPIFCHGKLMLYAASLQDYSCHMDKLVLLKPSQFCRTLEHHQCVRHVKMPLTALQLTKPAHLHSTISPPQLIKQLGWSRLALEPEYLQDLVADALQTSGVKHYKLRSYTTTGEDEILSIHAINDGVTVRVMIAEDGSSGLYKYAPPASKTKFPHPLSTPAPLTASCCARSVTVTRVSGDTFEFHEVYRKLRGHLHPWV